MWGGALGKKTEGFIVAIWPVGTKWSADIVDAWSAIILDVSWTKNAAKQVCRYAAGLRG